jgi:hypothetical protein
MLGPGCATALAVLIGIAVPLANGLVCTYTRPPRGDGIDAWYLTALDFRTGRTVYRRLAGTGLGFNNNYAPVTLGPDGTA